MLSPAEEDRNQQLHALEKIKSFSTLIHSLLKDRVYPTIFYLKTTEDWLAILPETEQGPAKEKSAVNQRSG
jgi:hypothetical protein